jgi:hypothetical protein
VTESEITHADTARAARIVIAQLTGDLEMFAAALNDAVDDPRDWSVANVIRSLSEDLATTLRTMYGDRAPDLVRAVLASQLAAVDQ